MSDVVVCAEDSSGWPLRGECEKCGGHPAVLHPGRGGKVNGCLACIYKEQYGDAFRNKEVEETIRRTLLVGDDRDDLLDVIAALIDTYAFPDIGGSHDSRSLPVVAIAMRVLAMNGRFKIESQEGRHVTGKLLRDPPWIK